ncbi:MAG: hypothetical protein SAJ12_01810, partial [Jaaginema sp. PMC 1079.18]|nr:hypothetical protein [Jaaginema sp. PMC 1079.18]
MTQLPNPENEPEPNNPSESPPSVRRRRRLWLWVSLAVVATLGGGLTVGWFVLKQQLTPHISRILTEA